MTMVHRILVQLNEVRRSYTWIIICCVFVCVCVFSFANIVIAFGNCKIHVERTTCAWIMMKMSSNKLYLSLSESHVCKITDWLTSIGSFDTFWLNVRWLKMFHLKTQYKKKYNLRQLQPHSWLSWLTCVPNKPSELSEKTTKYIQLHIWYKTDFHSSVVDSSWLVGKPVILHTGYYSSRCIQCIHILRFVHFTKTIHVINANILFMYISVSYISVINWW